MAEKILFDTNAIIDLCGSSRPRHDVVRQLFEACVFRDMVVIAPVSSLKDMYYVMTKTDGEEKARQSVRFLMRIMTVVDLLAEQGRTAVDSDEPDFENGLVRAVAEWHEVQAIITHDVRAFKGASVPVCTADEYLRKLEST